MKLHSINAEQRLYVIGAGSGFSCYGFDVLDSKAKAVSLWMHRHPKNGFPGCAWSLPTLWHDVGTQAHFEQCGNVLRAGQLFSQHSGDRCPAELEPKLAGLEGRRVEVTSKSFDKPRRFWVGKSTGWMPCHLELATKHSTDGGCAYLPPDAVVTVVR